jgi:hypothetical protein
MIRIYIIYTPNDVHNQHRFRDMAMDLSNIRDVRVQNTRKKKRCSIWCDIPMIVLISPRASGRSMIVLMMAPKKTIDPSRFESPPILQRHCGSFKLLRHYRKDIATG